MKNKKNTNKGITLIALVITVIVLLILAGVALATLTGDSGILSNAENAKEQTTQANVKEKVQLAIMEHKIGQYSEGKTLQEYLEAAGATGVSEDGTEGKMDGYTFEIKDGEVTVTKETSDQLTLGDVYDEMMFKVINYTTNEDLPDDVKWVIIGQDDNGDILATTLRPLGMSDEEEDYRFKKSSLGAEVWLNYEDNLNTHCAELFSGSVQGEAVKVESIDIEHVNKLMGFTEPEFNTYTFKNQANNDYTNKIVNYWHPDVNGNATESDGTGDPTKWSKAETEYECNAYGYWFDLEELFTSDEGAQLNYKYEGNNWTTEKYTERVYNLDNENDFIIMCLVFGLDISDTFYKYALATSSVNVKSDEADFEIGYVDEFVVACFTGVLPCCTGNSTSFDYTEAARIASPVRPVVTLSSKFIVEEQEDGTYALAD